MHVFAEDAAIEHLLARAHPRCVAAERGDLPVVTEGTERLRELPARERVRAEALMDHRERAGRRFVLEGAIEPRELFSEQETLVDDGPRRQARHVEAPGLVHLPVPDPTLLPLA